MSFLGRRLSISFKAFSPILLNLRCSIKYWKLNFFSFVYVVCTNILLVEGERWWLPRIADEAILDTSRKMWGNWTKKFRWCTSQNLSTWLSSVGPGRPCDVDGRCGDGDNFAGGFENICFSLFEINCFCPSPKSPLSPIIYNFVNQSWISWAERSSWPRFLKPVTSSQKKLLKTLNPPTLSTIQTTRSLKMLKKRDKMRILEKKKKLYIVNIGCVCCKVWLPPLVISRRLLSTFFHGHLVNIPMMLGRKIQGCWVRKCHNIQYKSKGWEFFLMALTCVTNDEAAR